MYVAVLCARHCLKTSTCISLFNPNDSLCEVPLWFQSTNEETEAQRGQVTYSGSHSRCVVESRFQYRVWGPDCPCHHPVELPSKVTSPSNSGDICSGLVHLPMSQPRGKYFQNNCSGLLEDFVASSRWQTPSGAGTNIHNLELTGLNLILWEEAVCQGPWSSFLLSKGQRSRCWYYKKITH